MTNKSAIVAAAAMAAAACAGAGNDDAWLASIRRDHPRMFFNAETWPQVKARAECPARAERDALVRRCDGYPEDPVCSDFGPVEFSNTCLASSGETELAAKLPAIFEQSAAHYRVIDAAATPLMNSGDAKEAVPHGYKPHGERVGTDPTERIQKH